MWSKELGKEEKDLIIKYVESSSETPVVILDADYRIVECNRGFQKLLSLQHKPLGHSFEFYLLQPRPLMLQDRHLEASSFFREVKITFSTGDAAAAEMLFYHYPGEEHHFLFGERTFDREGEILQEFTALSNQLTNMNRELSKKNRELEITMREQKEAEEALRQSESLLNVTQELAKIGGWEYDVEKREMYWTREAYRIHGFNPDEMDPASIDLIQHTLSCFEPEHRPVVREALQRCAAEGKPFDLEFPFTTVRGERIWIRLQARAYKDGEKIGKVIGNIIDITRQKQAELKIDEYTMELELKGLELEEEIAERNRVALALEKAKEEAEQANASKSEFLANMSHEIRTPMNVIMGMSELLYNSNLEAEQQEYAEMVRESAASLLAIINDILDLSKIEAGRMELEQVAFNLRDEVEKVVSLVAFQAREKDLALSSEIENDVPEVICGDPTRLRQILLNLLFNAVKFTAVGEVALTVNKGKQDESASEPLSFAVRDTGIGIPEHKLDRLFQSFSQVDSSHTRKYGGTGLGLVISRRLVEMMGGEISVKSREGEGTTFTFTLPLVAEASRVTEGEYVKKYYLDERQEKSLSLSQREDIKAGLEILLVEDKPMNRKLATVLLEKKGWHVTPAAHGGEALELLSGQRFDLVLMDIQMPEMDGLETTQHIRAREKNTDQRLPIIAMTAHAMKGDREKYLEAGMDGYVSKPINAAELYEAVNEVLLKKTDAITSATRKHDQEVGTVDSELAKEAASLLETLQGDKELLLEMIALLFEDAAVELKSLQEHLERNEPGEATRLAHGLKGQLGNLGFTRAFEQALKLEQVLKDKEDDLATAARQLLVLEEEIKKIEAYFSDPP